MNVISRGIRNAFRNAIRTFSIVIILGLSIGLSLTMLVAHQAVGNKIQSVKSSVGNTVSVSPAGVRGFQGGGNALTAADATKLESINHVTAISESLDDRLTTSDTNLKSPENAGNLGQRFSQNSGQSYSFSGGAGGGGFGGSEGGPTVSFTPPIIVLGTNNPTNLSDDASDSGGGTFKLSSGTTFSSSSTADVAIVGSSLASKNNLKVGSTFTAYSTTIKVVGIYSGGASNTFANSELIMPLATVQTLSSQTGDLTSITLTADSVSNISAVTKAASTALGSSADVTNSAQEAQTTIAPLQNIQSISLYSLIGAVIAGSVITLLVMVMIVRERRREIGVIKAIGASNIKVVVQFMVEAVTFTVLASIIGIIIGVAGGSPITNLLVKNSSSTTTATGGGIQVGHSTGGGPVIRGGHGFGGTFSHGLSNVHAVVGWDIILFGLGAALVISIVGSGLASFFISKISPAEVMRSE